MRIWSISPEYLDRKRLGAAWYEALHCRKVIKGETPGYKNHPQILRISNYEFALDFINAYITSIFAESLFRGYKYNESYLERYDPGTPHMDVTVDQMKYEFAHNQLKIMANGDTHLAEKNLESVTIIGLKPGPEFKSVAGEIEKMEVVKDPTLLEMKKLFFHESIQN